MVATFTEMPNRTGQRVPHLRLVVSSPTTVRRATPASTYLRRRVIAVMVGLGVIGGVVQAGGALAGSSPSGRPARPAEPIVHIVQPGESLWSIAAEVAPNRDPREVVDALADARGTTQVEVGEAITWQG